MARLRRSTVSLLLALITRALCACECPYRVLSPTSLNASSSPSANSAPLLFTEILETDFLHVYALPQPGVSSPDAIADFGWLAQSYNVTPALARGPLGKAASPHNVRLNPLANSSVWTGSGTLDSASPPGLQLIVRGRDNLTLVTDTSVVGGSYNAVRMAELGGQRSDVRYASFRALLRMSAVPGTCAALFWYASDTDEIDVEHLSRSAGNLSLVLQTPLSASRGYDASLTPYYHVAPLRFPASEGWHEYRVDWTPRRIAFLVDGALQWAITDASVIPSNPGHFVLNHWSNGDGNWSGGPPERDAVLSVAYVKAYFNSSDDGRRNVFDRRCSDAGGAEAGAAAVCTVQEVDFGAAQGSGGTQNGGGIDGQTPFVTPDSGWAEGPGKRGAAGARAVASRMAVVLAVAVAAGVVVM